MTSKTIATPEPSIIESIDQLFLRFIVGKNKIYKEEEYNDGLSEAEQDDKELGLSASEEKSGWNQRILLEVEKDRVKRVEADKRLKDKRNALLMRYFQQSLLKVVNEKLQNSETVISDQLQLRENTVELLKKLLAGEPRYSVLASLLELNPGTRNRLLSLVCSEDFMSALGRDPRNVRDIQSAIGMIGTDVLRFLVPAILFKYRINAYSHHNSLFAKKLWRYEMTLGQTCTALMHDIDYRRPYEGMLLSAMVNFAYVASYQQYLTSFEMVRTTCLDQARDKGEKNRHDFFYDIKTDSASLQALLVSQADLKLSLVLSEKLFQKSFPHLVNALKEEVEGLAYEERTAVGKILYKAVRFAKYDQLRSSRLFKSEWVDDYLAVSNIEQDVFKNLLRQELFRFKPIWS
ncbi:HDOD domain-containing protein [Psychromonas ossibalaenae]|uniref:HDOD domain-containing protein n=1 Tax=Psychromonas ossibalaenae TaxID=444922 RepID=UPI000374AEBE|nr:HDOD domain-containing protein [Psychromonas ossibalaenae]